MEDSINFSELIVLFLKKGKVKLDGFVVFAKFTSWIILFVGKAFFAVKLKNSELVAEWVVV